MTGASLPHSTITRVLEWISFKSKGDQFPTPASLHLHLPFASNYTLSEIYQQVFILRMASSVCHEPVVSNSNLICLNGKTINILIKVYLNLICSSELQNSMPNARLHWEFLFYQIYAQLFWKDLRLDFNIKFSNDYKICKFFFCAIFFSKEILGILMS